ncbi:MAG: prepilin-type N-terminal cleavage/methylation domain-containing protein [Planctomycetes bacterium]|nr:prepilin-type N-terminal cleavage/methylation domain-containing protein [Planctomycetota bacterium]
MSRKLCTKSGFSMIELIMASIVLAIALMGTLSAIFAIHRMDQAARENELATQGATEMMEEVFSSNLSSVFSTYNNYPFDVKGLSEQEADPDNRVGLVTVDNTNPSLISVSIEVAWRGVSGNRRIQFDSKMADRD